MAAKKATPKKASDPVDESKAPALTAKTFALVKSLRKASHRLADFISRMETGKSAAVTNTNNPESLVAAVDEAAAQSTSLNELLGKLEKQV